MGARAARALRARRRGAAEGRRRLGAAEGRQGPEAPGRGGLHARDLALRVFRACQFALMRFYVCCVLTVVIAYSSLVSLP